MRCELTDLEIESCGHCKQKTPRPSFVTAFDSTCATCHNPLGVGQMAVWTLDGTGAEHARHAR